MIDHCPICGEKAPLGTRLVNFFAPAPQGPCLLCQESYKAALQRFREEFVASCASLRWQPQEWSAMQKRLQTSRGTPRDVWRKDSLQLIEPDALRFVRALMNKAYADNDMSARQERFLDRTIDNVLPKGKPTSSLWSHWSKLKDCARVREGEMLVIPTTLHLESGEVCHYQEKATYYKRTKGGGTSISGQLIATSRQIHFLGDSSSWTIRYDKVLGVSALNYPAKCTTDTNLLDEDEDEEFKFTEVLSPGGGYLDLKLAMTKGSGSYEVDNLEWANVVFTTLVQIHKRQILPKSNGPSRHIPQHVKTAVWQRDRGQCVQCGADDYLEFDHIIPHSKGGASTEGNVQLLCRRCNNKKSNRI